MDQFDGESLRLMRVSHKGLRQFDVAASMQPPVVRQRVAQLERRRRLSPEQWHRVAAAILAAAR